MDGGICGEQKRRTNGVLLRSGGRDTWWMEGSVESRRGERTAACCVQEDVTLGGWRDLWRAEEANERRLVALRRT